MSDRDMTADERRNFETTNVHHGDGNTPDDGPLNDPGASATRDDSVASASGGQPAGQRRRLSTRPKAAGTGHGAQEFNPTSYGDERGEVT